jgi:hypothetical protein
MKLITFCCILLISFGCIEYTLSQSQCTLIHNPKTCKDNECEWCTTGKRPFCSIPGTCPSGKKECNSTEYCCPDAKHCLTPTNVSCVDGGNEACAKGEVCCPLTKICVKPGNPCETPCGVEEYCCPDAKHCLTPVNPGVFCNPKDKDACGDNGDVCCPATHIFVTGQHTSPLSPHASLSFGLQNTPGFTGVKQCFASGQQYSSTPHGVSHGFPGLTQIFVNGQHTSPFAQASFPPSTHETLVGVKQCFASGQQYSVLLHSFFPLGHVPGIEQNGLLPVVHHSHSLSLQVFGL